MNIIEITIQLWFVLFRLCVETECVEYQDAVNERVYSSVGLNTPPIEQKVFRCSIATVPLIVGGENALPKEFPHMVKRGYSIKKNKQNHFINAVFLQALIGFEDRVDKRILWKCGASLISDFFLLTAAHCMYAPGMWVTHFFLAVEMKIIFGSTKIEMIFLAVDPLRTFY